MQAPGKLAIVIPMYNEEANAEKCVRAVCAMLSDRVPNSKLIAVNDGSRDRTGIILKTMAATNLPFIYVEHKVNQGYGTALMTGARKAQEEGFEFALFMDSDLTNDPALIPIFAKRAAEERYDLIKASRYVSGGGMRGVPLRRQIPSRIGNWIASRLFGMGIRDCTNGFRAVRLSLVCSLSFRERSFPMILEELLGLKKLGARVTEIPYILTAREAGGAGSKFSYGPSVILTYLKYALKAALVRTRPARQLNQL